MNRIMYSHLFQAILICLLSLPNINAQNISFTDEVYSDWLQTRIGEGDASVFWSCFGEVYSYPDGELICYMVGADMGNRMEITPDSIVQMSRKIFIYVDPETGEAYDTYNDQKVRHIQYPYQLISYVKDGDDLRTWVTQGAGNRIQTIGPGTGISARKMGSNTIYSAPLFLDFETPRGKYEAYENYDFIYNPNADSTIDKYQMTWVRYGDKAAFAGPGKGIIQLIAHRVDTWEELPQALKNYINEKAPMWKAPPANLQEIQDIQQGKIK
jgi:hypothetical protein